MRDLTSVFMGYIDEHREKIYDYAKVLEEKKICLDFMIRGYAEFSDLRSLDLFIELFNISNGGNYFIYNGIQRHIVFKVLGYLVTKSLQQRGASQQDLVRKIESAPPHLQQKLREYLRIQI